MIQHEESTQYAEQLVALARQMGTRAQPALSMANRSDLSARVSAVLDPRRPRGRAGMLRAALVVSTAAAMLLALAPLRLVASVTSIAGEEQRRPRVQRLDRALVEAVDEGDIRMAHAAQHGAARGTSRGGRVPALCRSEAVDHREMRENREEISQEDQEDQEGITVTSLSSPRSPCDSFWIFPIFLLFSSLISRGAPQTARAAPVDTCLSRM